MSHLKNRVVVITGAAGGFGRLLANMAASRGALIVGTDVNEAELDNTVSQVTAAGGKAIGIRADVTIAADMSAAVEKAVAEFGQVDILVNNAGIMPLAYLSDHAEAAGAWDKCIDINIKGVLHGIMAVHDQMIKQGKGHVVNLSSIYGNFPTAGAAVYGASKAAVNYMSDSLRKESQGKIKVTTIRPTGVPATGLAGTVVDDEAGAHIIGENYGVYVERLGTVAEGKAPEAWTSSEAIENLVLSPELLTEQILYAIDQPWGVSISDVTVRASGDMYVV